MLLASALLAVVGAPGVYAGEPRQQPTVAIPTVTGTPQGPSVRVNADQAQINVRSGPGTEYPIVGVLVAGQIVPAFGKSAAGLWIQIGYSGVPEGVAWVYSPLVTVLRGSELPIIEPPPTPTPLVTPTLDPTLAAQFVAEIPATRLPTFTAPPPLAIPTYAAEEPLLTANTFPVGLLISILGIVGMLGAFFSALAIRR
ncbi:MAG: SH3 domain-containing protein [Chloroflexi bacterium]|nr:SH3 domain-containing protein [Chloroflexota bacterium]